MKYLIEDILFKQSGISRTDWKYPMRIGSIVDLLEDVTINKPLHFRYVKYNNGEVVEDHITRTSIVDDFDGYSKKGYLYVYTKNSIYIFKELGSDE